jgi:hypothetical protein
MWAEAAAETNYLQSIFSLMADFWKSCGPLIFFLSPFGTWHLAQRFGICISKLKKKAEKRSSCSFCS